MKEAGEDWCAGGDTILNHGCPVALAGYFQERVGTLLHFIPKLHLPPLACRGTFCGFSARTYLYRIFKLKEGCTPAEWREKMAENVAAEDKKQDQPFFDKYQEYTSQNEKIR